MIYSNEQKNIPQYSDQEAIEQVLAGNTAIFEILIRRYNPFLYKTGRGYGFNHQDTEDLMQETFINCYQSLSTFENRSSFKTWIVKIMIHQCYHKAYKQRYSKEKKLEGFITHNTESMLKTKDSDTGKSVINKELNSVIEAAISRLPEDYRMTFTLRELTGLNVAETAELMHTTGSNVKVRLNRAKTMLRREIESIYSPEDIYEFNLVYCNKIVESVMRKLNATVNDFLILPLTDTKNN